MKHKNLMFLHQGYFRSLKGMKRNYYIHFVFSLRGSETPPTLQPPLKEFYNH